MTLSLAPFLLETITIILANCKKDYKHISVSKFTQLLFWFKAKSVHLKL